MTDTDGVRFQFSMPKDKDDTFQHVVLTHKTTQIHLDFETDPEGLASLLRTVTSLPAALQSIKTEVGIRLEVQGVDDELRQLLDTEGDEV